MWLAVALPVKLGSRTPHLEMLMHGLTDDTRDSRPIILVTADEKMMDGYRWHAAIDTYLNAVMGAGALPVILPSLGDALHADTVLDRFDGVMVTGSRSNVSPNLYGLPEEEEYGPFDHARDATTLPLIRAALDQGLPLLAICRGIQELNVALGGTLHPSLHDVEKRNDHRAPVTDDADKRFALSHSVSVDCSGQFRDVIGGPETIQVNSLHRQAIDRLADRLVIEARADDGTVEAVRVRDARSFAFGVQWHPEYWAASDPPSKALFAAFIAAAKARSRQTPNAAAKQEGLLHHDP